MAASTDIVIIGCGRLGALLANRLSRHGHSVVVIDQDESAFQKLTADFSGFQIWGDATELGMLRKANTDRADCLIATTDQDNLNLMLAQIARATFHVHTVIARVQDPAREHLYRELGIMTISPTQLAADGFLNAVARQPAFGP